MDDKNIINNSTQVVNEETFKYSFILNPYDPPKPSGSSSTFRMHMARLENKDRSRNNCKLASEIRSSDNS